MTKNSVYPDMGVMGWVTDPIVILDKCLANFYLTDYLQSNLFFGQLHSLPKILQEHGNRIEAARIQIESQLQIYLAAYFDKVNVSVSVEQDANGDGSLNGRETLNVVVEFQHDRVQKVGGAKYCFNNGVFTNLLPLVNG